jgi:uncharacterized protein YuzE
MGKMRIWYDEEGDYLEIGYGDRAGYMKDVGDDVWLREENGQITGFAILGLKKRVGLAHQLIELPISVHFSAAEVES